MKRILLLAIATLMLTGRGNAQQAAGPEYWSGKLTIGLQQLNIGFSIKALPEGKQVCSMDVPEQGAKDIPAELVRNDGDSLVIKIAALRAAYHGAKIPDGSIKGIFTQNGIRLALDLAPGKLQLKRPQTPVPPFGYRTKEVVFRNDAEGAELAGTLTYPTDFDKYPEGTVPVVLMVTGSGTQNRDEELFDHKPFLVIADFLAKNGIASLRYDDRGAGKSTGPVKDITTMNNLADAEAGISFLRSLGEFGQTGVLGHSEGGTIAFMMGARKSVDFLISLAGTAVTGLKVIVGQNEAIMQKQGLPAKMVRDYATALEILYGDRISGKQIPDKTRYVEDLCSANGLELPANLKSNLEKCTTAGGEWLTWFLGYDPAEAIREITCPVFALNGTLDLQVLCDDNLPVIKSNLPHGSSNLVKEYDGLNHLFQHATPFTALNYGAIEETISAEVLNDIAVWINRLAK